MVFSIAMMSEPPGLVAVVLHVFGLASHSAKPGDEWSVVDSPPLPHAAAPSATTSAAALSAECLLRMSVSSSVVESASRRERRGDNDFHRCLKHPSGPFLFCDAAKCSAQESLV